MDIYADVARVSRSFFDRFPGGILGAFWGTPAVTPTIPRSPLNIDQLPVEMLHKVACLLDKPDLVSLVRVSARWQAIVEPILWRDLPCLLPLVRLLDLDIIVERYPFIAECEARVTTVSTEQPEKMPQEVWHDHPNVLRLASHVRTLLVHPISDFGSSVKLDTFDPRQRTFMMFPLFKAVCVSLMKDKLQLFPRLRTLEIGSPIKHGFPGKLLEPFINPGLASVVTHCQISQFNYIDRSSINNFQFFEWSVRIYSEQGMLPPIVVRRSLLLDPTISAMTGQIGSLRTLKLRLLYSQDLHVLLAPGAQCLRSLDLDIKVLADPVDTYGLRGLQYLKVRKQSMAFACALLGSSHMEEIDLLEAISVDSHAIAQVLTKIRHDCQANVLRRVCIHENDLPARSRRARAAAAERQTWHIARCHLDALAPFHGLVEVDIRTSGELLMSDDDWAAVVSRWCSLRIFKVEQFLIGQSPLVTGTESPLPGSTLSALLPFATYCPELEELSFQLHATTIPTLAAPQQVQSQIRLRELNVGCNSGINANPALVSDFLHILFPSLRSVKVVPKPADLDAWAQVQGQVRAT
ncbi:hypothetical protein BD626DRAFT_491048 [Schizophyllum amplum]|uniref:F-box domain-containing protein n=1 Tax=Schizophyllum amplum TaxID=97359 RepID=A0A550CHE5_9AGAR|nr:hypothetical protein BD626DRAFT_491048 [Auriculariopsis ampla]